MSLVGGSAKIPQERRQRENPKQIHHDYICKATAETESARNGLQRGLRLRALAGNEDTWKQPVKQLSFGGKRDEYGSSKTDLQPKARRACAGPPCLLCIPVPHSGHSSAVPDVMARDSLCQALLLSNLAQTRS